MREKDLDLAFAERLKSSEDFCRWVLGRTGFSDLAAESRLLYSEQTAARPRVDPRFWYRHWWCRLPDGTESETDILAVFGRASVTDRFALHIENKPPNSKFTQDQEKNYARRAEFMATKTTVNYSTWETVLLAPRLFCNVNSERCASFDCFISYEDLSLFVPEFGAALSEAGMSPT